jgi:hypothetical protein
MAVNPQLVWEKPIDLPAGKSDPAIKSIPTKAGVYIFFREHGDTVQIFYVGKARKLQGRIKIQLNNHGLMTAISNAKNGKRRLVWAELKNKSGQNPEISLKAAEKLMIRHYVEKKHPICNVQGKRISVQRLTNKRNNEVTHFIPAEVTREV